MKTLIILKGQLRTWHEGKSLLKSYINELVKTLKLQNADQMFFPTKKVDILVSCWDISYQLYPNHNQISYLYRELSDASKFREDFADCDAVDQVYFNKLNYLKVVDMFEKAGFWLDEEYHLQCYLTYQTGLTKRRIEAETKSDYDIVIELRPDVFYEYETSPKILRRPNFGEILALHGNNVLEIHGIMSPMCQDLMFCVTGKTYNIFSKEILFHYRNKLQKKPYTTAHVEKNLFYMKNNFQVNGMNHGLASMAIIIRPTIDWNKLNQMKDYIQKVSYIRQVDDSWRGDKARALDFLIKQGLPLDEKCRIEKKSRAENLEKIRNFI